MLTTLMNISFEHLLFICSFLSYLEAFFGLRKASNGLDSRAKKDCRECKPASNVDCRGLTHIVRALWGFW